MISDLVVSETYYALQYHYGVSKADALASLASLLSTGEISATGEAGAVLAQAGLATAKPGFLDRLIHAGYAKAGAAMATFENAGRKLRNVTVLK